MKNYILCPGCGKKMKTEFRSCPYCGIEVSDEQKAKILAESSSNNNKNTQSAYTRQEVQSPPQQQNQKPINNQSETSYEESTQSSGSSSFNVNEFNLDIQADKVPSEEDFFEDDYNPADFEDNYNNENDYQEDFSNSSNSMNENEDFFANYNLGDSDEDYSSEEDYYTPNDADSFNQSNNYNNVNSQQNINRGNQTPVPNPASNTPILNPQNFGSMGDDMPGLGVNEYEEVIEEQDNDYYVPNQDFTDFTDMQSMNDYSQNNQPQTSPLYLQQGQQEVGQMQNFNHQANYGQSVQSMPVHNTAPNTPQNNMVNSNYQGNNGYKQNTVNQPQYNNANVPESPRLTVDTLTGVYDRNSYEIMFKEVPLSDLAIIYLDVNNLKSTNDNIGHNYGNKLLQGVSHKLSELFPQHVYRIGGDEFVVLLNGVGPQVVKNKIQEFNHAMKLLTDNDTDGVVYQVAIGIAFGDGAMSKREIEDKAESLMYSNKKALKSVSVKSSVRKPDEPDYVANNPYNPNHDGYYNDRLPELLDEITKASHTDTILRIILILVGIIALIVYCIFYVNV